MGKSGETSREAREAYNRRNYVRYTFRVRCDSGLYDDIEEYMKKQNADLSGLVKDLLKAHFMREDPFKET